MLSSGYANAATVSAAYPTGTLNVTGTVLDKGCTINAKDFVIQLPPVVNTAFTAAGDMGEKSTAVPFTLTGCPTGRTMSFIVTGTVGSNANTFKIDAGTNKATGVDLILYNGTGMIRPNFNHTLTLDSSGNYTSTFSALLRSNVAAVTAGAVDTVVTYTLAYN